MAVNPEPGSPIMRVVLTTTVAVAAFIAFVGASVYATAVSPGTTTPPPDIQHVNPVVSFASIGVSVLLIWFLISLAHRVKTKHT